VTNVEDVGRLEVKNPEMISYVTQTTLSLDDTRDIISALRNKFPSIIGPDVRDICYATQNRQQAVREITSDVDLMLVVGAQNSSNSNRLKEIGADTGVPSYLIDDAPCLDLDWLDGVSTIGITAGASAPEELVDELLEKLKQFGEISLEMVSGVEENIQFKLPPELIEAETDTRHQVREA